jgi:prephenate dehydratase
MSVSIGYKGFLEGNSCTAAQRMARDMQIENESEFLSYDNNEDLFTALERDQCDYIVIQLKCNHGVSFPDVKELLDMEKHNIVKTYDLVISYALCGPSDVTCKEDVKNLLGHDLGFIYCKDFVEKEMQHAEIKHINDINKFITHIEKAKGMQAGVLCPSQSSTEYELNVIEKWITPDNLTTTYGLIEKISKG